MSFMDNLKRSLGFEETETKGNLDSSNKDSALSNISASAPIRCGGGD